MRAQTFRTVMCILCIIPYTVFSQIEISGTVINKENGEPVPYAYVKKKSINRGAITNEDGFFRLTCEESDTLIISFVSFQKKEVPAVYFQNQSTCYLEPSLNELTKVDVYANFDFLYALFDKARKNLRKAEDYPSKTYFSLETSTNAVPVELLECYYNAEVGPSGINDLELKNGRIGMSRQSDGTYFASLNTTDIISGYRLFNKRDNKFPGNPLQLNKSKLKRFYHIKILAFEDGVYKVGFNSRMGDGAYFDSKVWIDKHTEQIVRIDLMQENLKKHPIREIDPAHHIDSLNFNISYTFSNDDMQSLDKIAFQYDLNYTGKLDTRKMNSGGVFLFFDKENEFDLPFYSAIDEKLSDYDKIVAQPYNEAFWKTNEVLSPSKKAILYREYFKKTGVLLNFDELSKHNRIFQNRIASWSKRRVLLDEINEEGNYYVNNDYHRIHLISELYELRAQIYLDRNTNADSTYYLSKTLINLDESYYYLEPNKNSTCIVNLYYDLVEIERRHMMDIIYSRDFWTNNQIDSIYQLTNRNLDLTLKKFLNDVDHGNNDAAVNRYARAINGVLGVDNSLLIWSDYMADQIEEAKGEELDDLTEMYNYGTALMQIGKYEDALPILLEAYERGSRDPWLLYNIGLTYLKLDRLIEGCAYLKASQELGEEVPKELISDCN